MICMMKFSWEQGLKALAFSGRGVRDGMQLFSKFKQRRATSRDRTACGFRTTHVSTGNYGIAPTYPGSLEQDMPPCHTALMRPPSAQRGSASRLGPESLCRPERRKPQRDESESEVANLSPAITFCGCCTCCFCFPGKLPLPQPY